MMHVSRIIIIIITTTTVIMSCFVTTLIMMMSWSTTNSCYAFSVINSPFINSKGNKNLLILPKQQQQQKQQHQQKRIRSFTELYAIPTPPTTTTTMIIPPMMVGAVMNRFRKKRKIEQVPTISPGNTIKDDIDVEQIVVVINNDDDDDEGSSSSSSSKEKILQNQTLSIREVIGNGKTILVGMPGAFTPTCSKEHLPGYITNANKFAKLGYDNIVVVTTNDKFVNQEWMAAQGLLENKNSNKITMICDGDGDLVKSLGLAEDMGFGVGIRSKRFVLLVENGIVTEVLTDEGMDTCDATSAGRLLEMLTPTVVESNGGDNTINPIVVGGMAAVVALGIALQGIIGGSTTSADNASPPSQVNQKAQPNRLSPTQRTEENFSLLRNYIQ